MVQANTFRRCLAGLAGLLIAATAAAQDFPSRTLRILVPYTAQAGRLRILANAAPKRDKFVPEVPSVVESVGISDFNFRAEIGLVAVTGTPKPIIDKLARSLSDAQKDAPYPDTLKKLEYDVATSTPEEFSAMIRNDPERFRAVAKAANIKAQ